MVSAVDERLMARALELAERGRGLTSPNPMVGAVVVDAGGTIVGEGAHLAAGTAHAEIEALAAAGPRARGGVLYVTLEPCVHAGRTPACVPMVVGAGVCRVAAAIVDPDPRVSGRGLAALRASGIVVECGVLAAEAERQNRVFLTAIRRGRPHVTLKAAISLDGRMADRLGQSRWISGTEARAEAHRLRSETDAVAVGVGTILADDPLLTVRRERPWPREPLRVVFDTFARTPPASRVLAARTPERTLVLVGPGAPVAARAALARTGASVVEVRVTDQGIDVAAALEVLTARNVRGLLVEGGARLHGAFVDAGTVDRVAVFVAPRLLGGLGAPAAIAGLGRTLESSLWLRETSVRRCGEDLLVEADTGPGEELDGVQRHA